MRGPVKSSKNNEKENHAKPQDWHKINANFMFEKIKQGKSSKWSPIVYQYHGKVDPKRGTENLCKEGRSDQNGAEWLPKATKREPKGCQNEPRELPKHRRENRVGKVMKKGAFSIEIWLTFMIENP